MSGKRLDKLMLSLHLLTDVILIHVFTEQEIDKNFFFCKGKQKNDIKAVTFSSIANFLKKFSTCTSIKFGTDNLYI